MGEGEDSGVVKLLCYQRKLVRNASNLEAGAATKQKEQSRDLDDSRKGESTARFGCSALASSKDVNEVGANATQAKEKDQRSTEPAIYLQQRSFDLAELRKVDSILGQNYHPPPRNEAKVRAIASLVL